ncbi:MAG: cytochrome c maturation protein CcmE [Acidobacteria bacterium]|nr:cytochrome c maturation protein CcmE [Acidobacteriota bacterium]
MHRGLLIAFGVALAGVAAWLIVSGLGEGGAYYFHVSEVVAGKYPRDLAAIRVSGTVPPGTASFDPASGDFRFRLRDHRQPVEVTVVHRGMRPENFREGKPLVAEGRYDPATRVFTSTALILKCPSKYEKQ